MSSFPRRLAMLPGFLAFVAASAYATCGDRFVAMGGTDGPDCDQGAPCATIQHAVDVDAAAACSGDAVNVAAGTYTEQVTIPTSLNLVGEGAANTFIKAPATLAAAIRHRHDRGGATVDLSGFTVTGPVAARP